MPKPILIGSAALTAGALKNKTHAATAMDTKLVRPSKRRCANMFRSLPVSFWPADRCAGHLFELRNQRKNVFKIELAPQN
jgi:hypothetical protein